MFSSSDHMCSQYFLLKLFGTSNTIQYNLSISLSSPKAPVIRAACKLQEKKSLVRQKAVWYLEYISKCCNARQLLYTVLRYILDLATQTYR